MLCRSASMDAGGVLRLKLEFWQVRIDMITKKRQGGMIGLGRCTCTCVYTSVEVGVAVNTNVEGRGKAGEDTELWR